MPSNPTWTRSNSEIYAVVDTLARDVRPTTVPPPPYLYPCAESPDDIDPLWLHRACQDVLTDLYCCVSYHAEHNEVPEDSLQAMVTDWLVSCQMGVEPSPATLFIPEREKES
jgi:hypothetical protein